MAAAAVSEDQIDINNFEFHEKIGRGGFGSVSRVTFKTPYKGYTEAAAKSVVDFRPEEVEIMIKLCHPHIVKLLGFYTNGPISVILLEYAPNGSLHDFLEAYRARYPGNFLPHGLIRRWAEESALALSYLHQNKILHRDIKGQNCLLFQDYLLKLCDFGFAKELELSQSTSSQKGTFRYMAPEIIRGNTRGRSVYSKWTDIYAYGMLLLEICTMRLPFDNLEYGYIVFNVGLGRLQPQPPTPLECPQELVPLIRRCWNVDPLQRPSIEDIIEVLSVNQQKEEKMETMIHPQRVWTMKTIHPQYEGKQIRAGMVACCPNDDFLVADLKKAYIVGRDGISKRSMGSDSTSDTDYIVGVAVSSQGHILVLVGNFTIMVFDERGRKVGRLVLRHNTDKIAADIEGNILLGSGGNNTVRTITCPQGSVVNRLQNHLIVKGGSLAINSKDQILLHLADDLKGYTKVTAMDYFGREVFSFIPKIDEDMSEGVLPSGIACDAENNIYVALSIPFQRNNGHIHKYDCTGAFLECIVKGLYQPSNLAITPDGSSLVVANIDSILIFSKT